MSGPTPSWLMVRPNPLNAKGRARLGCLARRRDYLAELLRTGESTLSWDRQEVAALTWAIEQIETLRAGESA